MTELEKLKDKASDVGAKYLMALVGEKYCGNYLNEETKKRLSNKYEVARFGILEKDNNMFYLVHPDVEDYVYTHGVDIITMETKDGMGDIDKDIEILWLIYGYLRRESSIELIKKSYLAVFHDDGPPIFNKEFINEVSFLFDELEKESEEIVKKLFLNQIEE